MAATAVLFVRPESDDPSRSDAIVVLGPGLHGERFAEGLRLMRRGLAGTLLISEARDPNWTAATKLCSGRAPLRVICFRASPYTTRGEARIVARLAREHGWRSLVIVTSTYHVQRARILYRRCFGGRLAVVGAQPSAGLAERAARIGHEWGGLAYALVFARGC